MTTNSGFLASVLLVCAIAPSPAWADESPYPVMAPLRQYLMSEESEIALARSAAPSSVSAGAEVMTLGRHGYRVVEKGNNGFLCLVERSWAKPTTDPEFWNPKVLAPNCFNRPAAKTFVPIYLKKTKLVLEGKSRSEIAQAIAAAFSNKQFPALEPGAMCYMMSKEQYLEDRGKRWHPHLMFFVSGDAAKSWGANLPDSPVIAANDTEERATVFMIWVSHWSDGTPAP